MFYFIVCYSFKHNIHKTLLINEVYLTSLHDRIICWGIFAWRPNDRSRPVKGLSNVKFYEMRRARYKCTWCTTLQQMCRTMRLHKHKETNVVCNGKLVDTIVSLFRDCDNLTEKLGVENVPKTGVGQPDRKIHILGTPKTGNFAIFAGRLRMLRGKCV